MRVVLIGLGEAGAHIHLPALASMPSVSVTGACDLDADRRASAAAAYRVPVFADAGEMLSACRPDVVIIGTPPDSHADYCLRAIDAGAHVICEKPFMPSLDEADAVNLAARRAGRQVAVNHEFREMPIFRALRDAIAGPPAADLRFVQMWQLVSLPPGTESAWRTQLAQRTLFEAGVHLVDLAMALFGERPVSVQASMFSDDGPAVDAVAAVTLEFSRGRLAHLTQNRLCKGERQYFEVRADTAADSLRASFGGRARVTAGLLRGTSPHLRFEFGRSGLAWRETGNRRVIIARNPRSPNVAATRAVFDSTLQAFQSGAEPPTSGDRARSVLAVIAACYHAAATGRRLRLDDPAMTEIAAQRMGTAPGFGAAPKAPHG